MTSPVRSHGVIRRILGRPARTRTPHRSSAGPITGLLVAIVFAFAFALLLVHPASGAALLAARTDPGGTSPSIAIPFKSWSELRYKTSKLLIFTGDLVIKRTTAADTVSVRSDSQAKLFGSPLVNNWSVSTMDRKTGRPLSFLDVRPGKKAERWAFRSEGVVRETLKPPKKAPDTPFEKWVLTKTQKFDVQGNSQAGAPTSGSGGSAVSNPSDGRARAQDEDKARAGGDPSRWVHDYISMIVRLRDLPLMKTGDEASVLVSTSRGPVVMKIRVGEERTGQRDLIDLATGKSTKVPMKELRLRVTPVGASASDTRGFLDMEGEAELWVEATTRTLVEVSGDVPKVPGRVVITLAGYRAS